MKTTQKRKRASARACRAPMRSPGRPPVWRREHVQRFWLAIKRGLFSEDAARQADVSPPVGTRWFREGGGMATVSMDPLSGRYLTFVEREEIAILHAQGCSVREIGRRLKRAASTISRELRRNAGTRSGRFEYRATTAQWHASVASTRSPVRTRPWLLPRSPAQPSAAYSPASTSAVYEPART